jgi:xylulokinase
VGSHVLGIDVSTTATKAIVVDEAGEVAGMGSSEYGFETPQPLWAEQDPALWWGASGVAIGAALRAAGI